MSVIPSALEVEAGGLHVEGQPGQSWQQDPVPKIEIKNKRAGGGETQVLT